ncbi:hypothetical protein D3C76_1591370 [compost metagenome]
MTEANGRGLAMLLVASTDFLPLLIVHQRQVDHAGERPLGKLDGRTHVHHWRIIEK